MDNKRQFKNFVATFAAFLAILVVVIASAGAISYGGWLYVACGIINLATIYPLVRWAAKRLRSEE